MNRLAFPFAFLFAFSIGCLFFIIGMYFAGSSFLSCERVELTQVNCTITEHRWLGLATDATPLTHVERAERESYDCKKNKRNTTCYRLVIVTKNGGVRPNSLSDGLAVEINQFLTSGQPTFKAEESDWLGGIIFMGAGGLTMFVFGSVGVTALIKGQF